MVNKRIFTILLGIGFIVFGLVVSAVMIPVQDLNYGASNASDNDKTSRLDAENGKQDPATGSVAAGSTLPSIMELASESADRVEKGASSSGNHVDSASQFWDDSMGSFYLPASYMEPVSEPFGIDKMTAVSTGSSSPEAALSSGPQTATSLASLASNNESATPFDSTAMGNRGSDVTVPDGISPEIPVSQPVPEPGTLALVSIGGVALLVGRIKRAKKK